LFHELVAGAGEKVASATAGHCPVNAVQNIDEEGIGRERGAFMLCTVPLEVKGYRGANFIYEQEWKPLIPSSQTD